MSDLAMAALRRVNLDWTVMLKGVWADAPGDVPAIHQDVRAEFSSAMNVLSVAPATSSPAGWVIVGDGGTGKTHLLGRFRAECARQKGCFVLVDMTDVRDFWDTVLLGYFSSLQELVIGRRPQYERLIAGVLGLLKFAEPTQAIINRLRAIHPSKLRPGMDKVLGTLHKLVPAEVNMNGDVIRALVALNSDDFHTANVGSAWLQGEEIDADVKKKLGMTRVREKSSNIVRGLSWLMSLSGPSIVALDQLDPIVTQLNLEQASAEGTPALSIINKLGAGLSELRDVTRRTLIVVSCVDRTWKSLKQFTPRQFTDRYNPPRILGPLNSQDSVAALLSERLGPTFAAAGFYPPYPTWPFPERFLQQVALDSPREVLKKCQAHINECVRRGAVRELPPGWGGAIEVAPKRFADLDKKFAELRTSADIMPLLDEQREDDGLGEIIRSALRCMLKEVALPQEIDPVIDETFTGAKAAKPLHARLRLVFPHEQSREEHFSFRALQKANAVSFTSRLRSAMTQAGIDKSLKFRRLLILRKGAPPGGDATARMVRQFQESGGIWHDPAPEDLATLEALRLMEKESHPDFVDWLAARRLASNTRLMQSAVPEYFAYAQNGKAMSAGAPPASPPQSPSQMPAAEPPPAPIPPLVLGRRLTGGNSATQPVVIPADALRKHGVVFAGAGSGKTVLLKRLVEEAALRGIPSIVVDGSNDLVTLGDRWQNPPPEWSASDPGLAETFFTTTERIIWTPGAEAGNPLGLEPLPDLKAMTGSSEELKEAIMMSVDALAPAIAIGPRTMEARKRTILQNALSFLSQQDKCTLDVLGEILRELPDFATAKIANERSLAREMAESLFALVATDPRLCTQHPIIAPEVLVGSGNPKTRISVISLVGLATPETQRPFLNRLAMALFSWIRKTPASTASPLRGLLVIDEARDILHSGAIRRLIPHARNYGLGIILGTQNPRDIDLKIIGQCATHWFGKMNSPTAIDASAELLKARGAAPSDDVGTLKPGTFYASNVEHIQPPARLQSPMCLSAHGERLEPDTIIRKASGCRT